MRTFDGRQLTAAQAPANSPSPSLLLWVASTLRKTGKLRRTALIYGEEGGDWRPGIAVANHDHRNARGAGSRDVDRVIPDVDDVGGAEP